MFRALLGIFVSVFVLWLVHFIGRALFASLGRFGVTKRSPGAGPFPSGFRGEAAAPPAFRQDLRRDPQCGTYIAPELSIQFRDRDQTLYFCSRNCEQKFLQQRAQKTA